MSCVFRFTVLHFYSRVFRKVKSEGYPIVNVHVS